MEWFRFPTQAGILF